MDPVFSILLRLRLASVIKLEYSFFRANNLLNIITCILVHNVLKLLSVPGQQRPKLFQPIFIISRVDDLFLNSIKGNAILTLLSFLKLAVCLPIGLLKLLFFSLWKIFPNLLENLSFSQTSTDFQKGV